MVTMPASMEIENRLQNLLGFPFVELSELFRPFAGQTIPALIFAGLVQANVRECAPRLSLPAAEVFLGKMRPIAGCFVDDEATRLRVQEMII